MSLIPCPECGIRVSTKATACPSCGCPSEEWASLQETESILSRLEPSHRAIVARNPSTPQEVLELLAGDEDRDVR